MPPTLDATPGGAAANSYVTVVEADAYFSARLFADKWTGALPDAKTTALLMATARVDQEAYTGEPTTLTQRLKWPLTGVLDDAGRDVDDRTIPRAVKDATCEIALALLTLTSDPAVPDPLAKFTALTLPGGLSLSLKGTARPVDALPDVAARLLAPFRLVPGMVYLDRIG